MMCAFLNNTDLLQLFNLCLLQLNIPKLWFPCIIEENGTKALGSLFGFVLVLVFLGFFPKKSTFTLCNIVIT